MPLRDALAALGDRPACLARNLTKPHERYQRGPLSELIAALEAEGEVRGEVHARHRRRDRPAPPRTSRRRPMPGCCWRTAPRPAPSRQLLVARHGLSKRDAYALVLRLRDSMTAEIVERVLRSSRYRDVDPRLLDRLAAEELPRAGTRTTRSSA